MPQHAFEDEEQPLAARVNYTSLFEDWKHFRCSLDSFICGFEQPLRGSQTHLSRTLKLLLLLWQLL
jgi:hypothetical protein